MIARHSLLGGGVEHGVEFGFVGGRLCGRIGAATQMPGAITSGFCKPSRVGPYEERYMPWRARSIVFDRRGRRRR